MMQKSVPPKKFGSTISAYQFTIIGSGCLATFLVGGTINFCGASLDKVMIGRIIGGVCAAAYAGSIACWLKAQ